MAGILQPREDSVLILGGTLLGALSVLFLLMIQHVNTCHTLCKVLMGQVAAELLSITPGLQACLQSRRDGMEERATGLCKRTMNELTAHRRLMKSIYKNILDLMLPLSNNAQASMLSSDCSHPSSSIHALLLHPSHANRREHQELRRRQ